MNARLHYLRHLLMRLAMGFVLAWFGAQQISSPGDWTQFIPEVIADQVPLAKQHLIILHSILLLLAATGLITGVFLRAACLLAIGLLLEIIVSLLLIHGASGLIVRDLGLLGLSAALALDPTRIELTWVRRLPWRPR